MDPHSNGTSENGGKGANNDEAKRKFDAFMSLNVDPFEDWPGNEQEQTSESDEEWNPPSRDSPSAHSDSDSEGSLIQDALLQSDEEEEPATPPEDSTIIATRTRARAPLTNVLLTDLEGMLQPEYELGLLHPGDLDSPHLPNDFDVNFGGDLEREEDFMGDEASSHASSPAQSPRDPVTLSTDLVQREKGYEQFLQVMQQGEGDLPAELAEDDIEYHVDPESYAAIPEEWYNVVGRISREEVEGLLKDTAPGRPLPETTSPYLDSLSLSSSPSSSTSSHVLEQLPEMTITQRHMLHQQVLQMLQLQIQVYLLSRHIDGNQKVSEDAWTLHNQFVAKSTSASTSYRPPSHHYPPTSLSAPNLSSETSYANPNYTTGSVPTQEQSFQIQTEHPPTFASTADTHNPMALVPHQSSTTQGIPQNLVSVQVNKESGGDKTQGKAARHLRPFLASVLALPTLALSNQESLARLHATRGTLTRTELNRYLGMYSGLFRASLSPNVDSRATMSAMTSTSTMSAEQGMVPTGTAARYRWSAVEDDLLAIGFSLFHKDWPLIRMRLLPAKDPAAIATRFKNKTSKKSKDNPVKSAVAYNARPLTSEERDMLTLGVSQCGHNFELIATQYLPSRRPQFLAKTWRQMTAASAKPKKLQHSKLITQGQTISVLKHTATLPTEGQAAMQNLGAPHLPQSHANLESRTENATQGEVPFENMAQETNREGARLEAATLQSSALAVPARTSTPTSTSSIDMTSLRERNRALQQAAEEENHQRVLHQQQQQQQAYAASTNWPRYPSAGDSDFGMPNTSAPIQIQHALGSEGDDMYSARSWDSLEESSDPNIIESARASSESASSEAGSDAESAAAFLPAPAKRHKYGEISDIPIPAIGIHASRTTIHGLTGGSGSAENAYENSTWLPSRYSRRQRGMDSGIEEDEDGEEVVEGGEEVEEVQATRKASRYPEDFHLRPFDASHYTEWLLDWEIVWQEEAVEAAITAAEAARAERLSGKPKSGSHAKAKAKAKSAKNAKNKASAEYGNNGGAVMVASATNVDWDHEVWITPPPTPDPTSASENASSEAAARMRSLDASRNRHAEDVAAARNPSPHQQQLPSPPPSKSIQIPQKKHKKHHLAQAQPNYIVTVPMPSSSSSSYSSSSSSSSCSSSASSASPSPASFIHQAAAQQSTAAPPHMDAEEAQIHKALQKELRHAQTYHPGFATSSTPPPIFGNANPYTNVAMPGAESPSNNNLPFSLPGGLFSVLTPEGRVFSTDTFHSDSPKGR